jgi:hypothetical protein
MAWSEEDIAQLLERRSDLLGRIAHHQSSSAQGEDGADARQSPTDATVLRLKLAEVEHYLAEAGLHFGS